VPEGDVMPLIPPALDRPVAIVTEVLRHLPFGPRLVTSAFVSLLANSTPPRPRPFTLAGDYTSWISLTDRSFTGRHLPVAPEGQQLPSEARVLELFRRPAGEETPSFDTSVLFLLFAQWFTDSFLRTDHTDWRKNTSTQEIDFCQIYGLSEQKTRLLRSMEGGRLTSQQIDGQEYPPFLFERTAGGSHAIKPEFKGLHDEDWLLDVLLAGVSDRRMTTADLDERLFQTTRLIMIVLLLKLVVEEYIRHIAPHDPPLVVVPGMAANKRWNRSSWIAVEFNLLYRWHMLVPDQLTTDEGPVESKTFLRDNNALVIERGPEWLMAQCSRSRAARIGLFNTPNFLTERATPDHPAVEERSIALMRQARLQSYNAYRQRFGMQPLRDFADLTSDVAVQRRLAELYGDVDHLEWYVGIFAEDYPEDQMMGGLLTAMVGYDAFTQALTNPVLAPQVFTEATFTRAGLKIIRSTRSLQQILARNAADPSAAYCRFTYGPER
jgi:prostaglandin-endoperoxide synthase 2